MGTINLPLYTISNNCPFEQTARIILIEELSGQFVKRALQQLQRRERCVYPDLRLRLRHLQAEHLAEGRRGRCPQETYLFEIPERLHQFIMHVADGF